MKITLDWSFELGPMLRTRSVLFVACGPKDANDQVCVRTAFVRALPGGGRELVDAVTGERLDGDHGVYAWANADAPSLEDFVKFETEKANRRGLAGRTAR